MNYKSFADLARDIATNLRKIPGDVQVIVGIPRSGLMAASILALDLNLKFCDLGSFLRNDPLASGSTRRPDADHVGRPFEASCVLVLDDSIDSGESMRRVKDQVRDCGYTGRVIYGAVYAVPGQNEADVYFEELRKPRMFEWNLFHRPKLEYCCVDIDGVLCFDPAREANDDGERYLEFLLTAAPLARPSYQVGHLVTSRLEKYRPQTEQWLRMHGVRYGRLHMLDLPSAAERRRLGCHATFKASVYRSLKDAVLFIESEPRQAEDIARRSGKPVLDFSRQTLVRPGLSAASAVEWKRSFSLRVRRRLKSLLGGAGA